MTEFKYINVKSGLCPVPETREQERNMIQVEIAYQLKRIADRLERDVHQVV